jgi:hypothetical protein
MPDRLPLAAKLPFIPSSPALAIRKAKQLRVQFPALSLGRARETYARVLAFKDWHAMEQALAALHPTGVTDDLLTPAGLRARQAWQIQAASTFAELPEEEISLFLKAWNPTGPARSKSSAHTVTSRAPREPVRPKGPYWEQAQTYQEAIQLEGLLPEHRLRLELMPWPTVRAQFDQMAQALEAETDLSAERCRLLTARAIDRDLPVEPADNLMRLTTSLGDELLDAALGKFEALGVYQALVPPHHQSGLVAKLRETAKLPEVSRFMHRAEGWNSFDFGTGINNFLAKTAIPERIESAGANRLKWLDKAWYSLKTQLGEDMGARAWSAMMGLPPSALEYVRDWAEHAPGRIEGKYALTQEHYSKASRQFERRLGDAGIFSQEPHARGETTLSRWLRPAELAGFMEGIDKAVLDHGPFSVSMPDAVNICRDNNASIQLSMTLARVNIGDIRVIYVHSIVCDVTAAKKLFRAGWPFAYMSALDSEVADAIMIQAGVSMKNEAYQLHSRKAPARRF